LICEYVATNAVAHVLASGLPDGVVKLVVSHFASWRRSRCGASGA
jgi:hypothetical protein